MEVDGGAQAAGEHAGGSTQPRRGGAWNIHDDAAAAGIFAAARATGARSVTVHYGEVSYKVWLEAAPSGEVTELDKRMRELQLATVAARASELERRAARSSARAVKERQRKKQQKANKKAAAASTAGIQADGVRAGTEQPRQQRPTGQQQPSNPLPPAQPMESEPPPRLQLAKEVAALVTKQANGFKRPSGPMTKGVVRVVTVEGLQLQLQVPPGSVAAHMSDAQLGMEIQKAGSMAEVVKVGQQLLNPAPLFGPSGGGVT